MNYDPYVYGAIDAVFAHPFVAEFILVPALFTIAAYACMRTLRKANIAIMKGCSLLGGFWILFAVSNMMCFLFFGILMSLIASKGTDSSITLLCFILPLTIGYYVDIWIIKNVHKKDPGAFLNGD